MDPVEQVGGVWWSLQLAPGWQGQQDKECYTITGGAGGGALQVSAARKADATVSDDELLSFAADLARPVPLGSVSFGAFTGFEFAFTKDEIFWRRWFLRSEHVALFVTYNCDRTDVGADAADVDAMLRTLCRRDAERPW